ncbi:unnamed protein product [Cunninghamella echinulata]
MMLCTIFICINDWYIANNLVFHFLRPLESPSNSIANKCREKAVVTWTTFPVLGTLFYNILI